MGDDDDDDDDDDVDDDDDDDDDDDYNNDKDIKNSPTQSIPLSNPSTSTFHPISTVSFLRKRIKPSPSTLWRIGVILIHILTLPSYLGPLTSSPNLIMNPESMLDEMYITSADNHDINY